MIMNKWIWMEEVKLSSDRYIILELVSRQTGKFRFAEIYHLLKKNKPGIWRAWDVKLAMEWFADMGLVKRKKVKAGPGQKWLFYQPSFDHDFLLSRIKQENSGNCEESKVYICQGIIEKIRYKYACRMERLNIASENLLYGAPFII